MFSLAYDATAQQNKKKPVKKKSHKSKKPVPKKTVPQLRTFTLEGRVEFVDAYCGGAKPSAELLEMIKSPKPYTLSKFFIKKGEANSAKNPVVTFIETDTAGKFSIRLKEGQYCIIQDFQTKPLQLENYKSGINYTYQGDDCMRKYWADCYQSIDLKSDTSNLIITIYKKCFNDGNPCMQYIGPMPP